ncbi:MAG: hypothetical protein GF330_03675, partial [Candidatus Eisenbacteria bacterium]|nr:hypothetical protein [Candidatus Eisenbacteria bacterium]
MNEGPRDRQGAARADARGPARQVLWPETLVLCLGALVLCAPALRAEVHRIALDGLMADWEAVAPAWEDPSGDGGPSGIDLGRVWIADDPEQLFLRCEVGCDLILQSDNQLTLYLDTDDDPATGYPVASIGAELAWE